MDATENEKLHQLNTMVLTDSPVIYGTPIYPFTETPDNEASVLLRSEELLRFNKRHGSDFPILITDNLGGSEPGYQGAAKWVDRLRNLHVAEHDIVLIPFTEPVLHTLSESMAMVRFAKERGWSKVVIIAPPFHMARCFLSAVTAVQHLGSKLRVYCQVGVTQPWNESALHSQKAVRGPRKELIVHELRRIKRHQRRSKFLRLATDGFMFLKAAALDGTLFEKLRKIRQYAKQGSPVPLVSTDAALQYLEWRDSR